jgi:membrane protease YdiL (CAAX protease family)
MVNAKRSLLRRYPVVAYFLLAYAISWVFWLPLAASSHGWLPVHLPATVFYSLAGLGPVCAALVVSHAEGGRTAVRALLGKLMRWRVGVRWYLVAILGYPALWLAGLGIDVLLGGTPAWPPPDLADLHMPFWFLMAIMPLFVLGEEIGWRGYALPRLQRDRSALSASLILSVLWSLWHIPSFLTRNSIHQDQSFALFMFWILQMTTVLTWLYNNTGGSVLHTWFFHVAMNYAGFLAPATMRARVLGSVFILAAVVLVVVLAGPARLSRRSEREET